MIKYKKFLIILSITLILFLSISSISASEYDSESHSLEISDSISTDDNSELITNDGINGEEVELNIEAKSITAEYKDRIKYEVKLYNNLSYEGKVYKEPKFNTLTKFKVYTGASYKEYSTYTNNEGMASININTLNIGTHKIEISSGDKTVTSYIKIIKSTPLVTVPSVTVKYGKSSYFYITVLNNDYSPVKDLSLQVKIYTGTKYKTYTIKTNANGIAKINTKTLKIGTHKVTISSLNSNYAISKSSKIIVKKTLTTPVNVTAPTFNVKYKTKSYFKITVLKNKKALKNIILKVKVYTGKKAKTYNIRTNSKGVVKINTKTLKIGTHKVKISNKKYKISKSSKIIVSKLDMPKLVSLHYYQKNNGYYAQITWNSVKNSKYQILRKSGNSYSVISTVKANSKKMSYYDKIGANDAYTYSVREIKGKTYGPYDKEGLKLLKGTNVKVDFQNLKATITWDKVSYATKYNIYRKMGTSGTLEYIASVNSDKLSYTDYYYKSKKALKSIMSSSTFIDASANSLVYTVHACNVKTVNYVKKTSYGLYPKDGDFKLEAPTILSVSNTSISWGTVPNAEGYLILKRNSANDNWKIIGKSIASKNLVQSTNLNDFNKEAYYSIQAYANKNGETALSYYDQGFTLKYLSENTLNQRILYIGDSITYGSPYYRTTEEMHIFSYPYRIAQLLGCVYYNPSIPGSTYHDLGQQKDGTNIENTGYYRYRISREVVDAIADGKYPGNWKTLDTAKNSENKTNTTIEDYNIVILAAGTNDYLDNTKLGDINSTDVKTFNGALNHILGQVEEASKNRVEKGESPIKVVFVDLFYSDRTNDYKVKTNRDVTLNKIGLTLCDYQNALDNQLKQWSNSSEYLTFYNFKTRDYNIVNKENCPYTASDNLHFTKFTYGQYGNALAEYLFTNVFS